MLKIETLNAVLSETVAPFFTWNEGEWLNYVKALLPHVQGETRERVLDAARKVAAEIDETYPKRPFPSAFVRHLLLTSPNKRGEAIQARSAAEIAAEHAKWDAYDRSEEGRKSRDAMIAKLRALGLRVEA